jgi:hypothetical protein
VESEFYIQARREWDERYGDLVLGKRNWQIASAGLMLLSLILALGIVWVSAKAKVLPYVVEVDKLGYAITIPTALNASSTPATVERIGGYWQANESDGSNAPRRAAAAPGLPRAESFTRDEAYLYAEPRYDGVAQLWFENADAMRAAFESPQGKALAADGPKFIDTSALRYFVAREPCDPAQIARGSSSFSTSKSPIRGISSSS